MKGKVLIIEENPALVEMWQAYLARHSYDVRAAAPGKLPMPELASWGLPDIIIASCDFSGRVSSGEEYCARVYGQSLPVERKLLPVIQLYSSFMSERQKGALKGVPFRLLQKPVSLPALLDAVNNAFFRHLSDSLHRKHTPQMTAELAGQALLGIFQFIQAGGKSGAVLVEGPSGQGFVFIKNSSIVTADSASLSGEEAMLEILTWNNGHASFYEFDPGGEPSSLIPSLPSLLSEAVREREEIRNVEKKLASPYIILQRNEYLPVNDKALFSEKLYMALEGGKDLKSLVRALPSLSYRQIMVSLAGMLSRNEVYGVQQSMGAPQIDAAFNASLAEAIRNKWPRQDIEPYTPCCIGVCSASISLSRKFIGALCGQNFAPFALLPSADGTKALLMCEVPSDSSSNTWDCRDYSGFILVFDRGDTASLPGALAFLNRIKQEKSHLVCVALPPVSEASEEDYSECAEVLGIAEEDIKMVPIAWSPLGCSQAVLALLELDSELHTPSN